MRVIGASIPTPIPQVNFCRPPCLRSVRMSPSRVQSTRSPASSSLRAQGGACWPLAEPPAEPVRRRRPFSRPFDMSAQTRPWFRWSFAPALMARHAAKNACEGAAITRRSIWLSCERAARSHRMVQGAPGRIAEGATGVRLGCRCPFACSARRRTTGSLPSARGRAWPRGSQLGRRALPATPSV
jgi:hypothetical protein